jgi:hypothetical protein
MTPLGLRRTKSFLLFSNVNLRIQTKNFAFKIKAFYILTIGICQSKLFSKITSSQAKINNLKVGLISIDSNICFEPQNDVIYVLRSMGIKVRTIT